MFKNKNFEYFTGFVLKSIAKEAEGVDAKYPRIFSLLINDPLITLTWMSILRYQIDFSLALSQNCRNHPGQLLYA